MKSRQFVDRVTVQAQAGPGGNGCVSFRREKFIPRGGPDGGDGGTGGSIVFEADRNADSLVSLFYAPHLRAGRGQHGKGQKLHGRNGKDLVFKVPCGTLVQDTATGEILADLVKEGASVIAATGGKGGLGNCHWLTSQHRAPREHTDGEPGEEKRLRLELKVAVQVGMVGFPNAGKSSLLAAISHAHPKVASYPFTTLHPIVGTIVFDDYSSLHIADIPGLIEGAHDGAGLGHSFLRHIERASALLYVIDMAGVDNRKPWDDYETLRNELKLHDPQLLLRPCAIAANKMDLPEAKKNLPEFRTKTGTRPIPVVALTCEGMDRLKKILQRLASGPRRRQKK
ncbi:MAG: GTPase ObgE [Lentisphaerales bacterium]|nr:MAG: GTPase ObgE [Lentisphaerales bacterium]